MPITKPLGSYFVKSSIFCMLWIKYHKEDYNDQSQKKGETHVQFIGKDEAVKFFGGRIENLH